MNTDINVQLRQELAHGCGFELLEHDGLEKAVKAWEELRDTAFEATEDMPTLQGSVYHILQGRKDDPANTMIEAVGMCLKHPGRKTWVIASGEEMDYEVTYWFAVDTVEDAVKLVEENVVRLRKEMAKPGDS